MRASFDQEKTAFSPEGSDNHQILLDGKPMRIKVDPKKFQPNTKRKQKRSGQPVIYLFAKTYGFSLPKPDKIVRPCPEGGFTGHLVFPRLGIKIDVKRDTKNQTWTSLWMLLHRKHSGKILP